MSHPIKRVEFARKYLDSIFAEDVHAKRVMSLANGVVGVMTGASLAVSIIGQSLASGLVQHRFCKFPAGWFCAATLPRRTSPAGDFFGVFFPTSTKESTTWGAARLSETSGCGKLNRNRRYRDDGR
jgi:hypothetical protein